MNTNIAWEKAFCQIYHSQTEAAKMSTCLFVAPAAIHKHTDFMTVLCRND